MKYVKQKDQYGCAAACMAMIFGLTYRQTTGLIADLIGKRDFSQDGMTEQQMDMILNECGYAIVRIHPRIPSSWPVSPFADIHICIVADVSPHAVIMDGKGRIYDPLDTAKRSLDDYKETLEVIGVFKQPKRVWKRYRVRMFDMMDNANMARSWHLLLRRK